MREEEKSSNSTSSSPQIEHELSEVGKSFPNPPQVLTRTMQTRLRIPHPKLRNFQKLEEPTSDLQECKARNRGRAMGRSMEEREHGHGAACIGVPARLFGGKCGEAERRWWRGEHTECPCTSSPYVAGDDCQCCFLIPFPGCSHPANHSVCLLASP